MGSSERPELLREVLALRSEVDDALERGLAEHLSIAEVLADLLPRVAHAIGSEGAFVESYAEDLRLVLFSSTPGVDPPGVAEARALTGEDSRGRGRIDADGHMLVVQPLDVAGSWFGMAGIWAKPDALAGGLERATELLELVCEELDNYLYGIRAAREKHKVTMALGRALSRRVLSDGLREAVQTLAKAMPVERMLLVFVAEEGATSTLHVQLYDGETVEVDTMRHVGNIDEHAVFREARDYLQNTTPALLDRFGFRSGQEQVLINGVTNSVLVGKIAVTSKTGHFNTYDRDLLASFGDFIRQRIVDFNKEWRRLASTFRADDVARLVQHDNYEEEFLTPREREVAILYTDIAGFTRLSETVLKDPAKVAKLVELWSEEAVRLVWEHGGVFDKMVGDCIIALFGPPFYESTPADRLVAAVQCADAIRSMTQELPQREDMRDLKIDDLGVSTGVNLAPLFVGTFGPNSNFTGFSSGMNNTARLQGCASHGEILVMEEAVQRLGDSPPFAFSDTRESAVKNVSAPLRYRALVTT